MRNKRTEGSEAEGSEAEGGGATRTSGAGHVPAEAQKPVLLVLAHALVGDFHRLAVLPFEVAEGVPDPERECDLLAVGLCLKGSAAQLPELVIGELRPVPACRSMGTAAILGLSADEILAVSPFADELAPPDAANPTELSGGGIAPAIMMELVLQSVFMGVALELCSNMYDEPLLLIRKPARHRELMVLKLALPPVIIAVVAAGRRFFFSGSSSSTLVPSRFLFRVLCCESGSLRGSVSLPFPRCSGSGSGSLVVAHPADKKKGTNRGSDAIMFRHPQLGKTSWSCYVLLWISTQHTGQCFSTAEIVFFIVHLVQSTREISTKADYSSHTW